MIDLTPVIQGIIGILAAVIAAFVIPFVKKKTTALQRQEMLEWAKVAVNAAEQILSSEKGRIKKEYVIDFLKNKGFEVNTTEVNNIIEAAVYSLKKDFVNFDAIPLEKTE